MKRIAIVAIMVAAFIGALATVGMVATQSGWQPPAGLEFLRVASRFADAGLFCHEHGVPERFCTLCHDELKTKLLMCQEHGLPEEICTICHPEAQQRYGLKMICTEHGLPRHLCVRCNPSLAGAEVASDWCSVHGVPQSLCTRCKPELAGQLQMCRTHDVPELLCTICRPELAKNFTTCKPHGLPARFCPLCDQRIEDKIENRKSTIENQESLPLVRLAGPDIAAKAGINTASVQPASVASVVTAHGEVGYDETRLARVRPRVSGIVLEARLKPGETVREGQLLAVIDSAELGQAKADYLAALPMVELWTQALARNRGMAEKGIVAEKEILAAETELRRAKAEAIKVGQRLRNLGLSGEQIARLADEEEDDRNRLRIIAPLAGTVVRRNAVTGEAVEAMTELFSVADVSGVWVHLDVYERDLRRVRVGQSVTFRVPGLAPAEFTGKVAWIDTEVNDQTRTIRVRAEVANPDGLLRANMFGKGEIAVAEPHTSLVVPRDAVQWEGTSYVVFVQKTPAEFEPRRVLVGQNGSRLVELAWADLRPGESVVTAGSFLLKTEIQKGAIGAGCCGE